MPVCFKLIPDEQVNFIPRIPFIDINQIAAAVGTKLVPPITIDQTEPSVLDNDGVVRIGTGSGKYALTVVVFDTDTYPER